MDVDVFRAMFLTYCVVWSTPALISFDRVGGATLRSFPTPYGHIFVGMLLISSVLSLYGILRRKTAVGVLYERAGQSGVGGLFVTYGLWAWTAFGTRATGFSLLLIFLGLGSILRVVQIEIIRRKGVARGPT